jgi:hypothetical protein
MSEGVNINLKNSGGYGETPLMSGKYEAQKNSNALL